MLLEEKIIEYKDLHEQIKALEEKKAKLYKQILTNFSQDVQEVHTENYRLKCYTKYTVRTSLDEARAFDAIKMEETVDKEKIKGLIESGIKVPNVTESSYFFIHNIEQVHSIHDEDA